MRALFRSLVVVVVTAFYIALVGPPVLLHEWLTGSAELVYRTGVAGVRLAMWLAGIRVRTEGMDRLEAGQTYLYVMNHASNADVAIIGILPARVAAMAKHTLFGIPLLGRALRVTGFIPIVRGTAQASTTVEAGVATLRKGLSLFAYPEGTRSTTGELQAFHRGVFLMAIRAGVPVVPITLLGTRAIMRKGDPRVHPGQMVAVFHEPIPTAGLREEDRLRLTERVRQAIASRLPAAAALNV